MKTVIFDIDGTLADLSHRLHLVRGGARRWDEFFALCGEDKAHGEIIELTRMIKAAHLGPDVKIILVTGRPEKCRADTVKWLIENAVAFDLLYMRPDGDYRKDFIVKSEILDTILASGHEILFSVDDRPSVVAMWRERGIVCLQCREWSESESGNVSKIAPGLLTLMIGPSGAGKSSWLGSRAVYYNVFAEAPNQETTSTALNIDHSHVVSSDRIRFELCGDFRDQSKNDQVFAALHAVVRARISSGLPTVVDATNLRRKDRMAIVDLVPSCLVRYIVIDRPLSEKLRDGGWRLEVKFASREGGAEINLIEKHHMVFQSSVREVLKGDGLGDRVVVHDLRVRGK